MKEVWRPIKGFESLYEVSNQGRIRNRKGKVLQHNLDKYGYPRVTLWKQGKPKCCLIHRAVAEAFCNNPNPKEFNQVNHKDEVKTNNKVSNLEWCDSAYNHEYGTRNVRAGLSKGIPVVAEVIETGEVEHYRSMKEAATYLGVTNAHICQAVHGKRNYAYGRRWKVDEEAS